MQDFEQLGVFYLGRDYDPVADALSESPVLYDSKDLTTHAVIVGMTGSGKTGLGVVLLEEAAIDGVPAIVIDPKGDMGNLLLAFPDLAPADFRPWVDEAEAARRGVTADALAQDVADSWRKGLASWGEDAARVGRYRDAVDATLYTPGSTAGTPLALLRSFAAPPPAIAGDEEALRERVLSTASGLLALLGVDADPFQSREHTLVSRLLEGAWREGRDLDLPSLIRLIQTPPFDRLGVLDLESFFPAKDRFSLAMRLNGLLASPGFAAWTQGDPLDVQRLLWTPQGRPRLSVVSVAHLSDAERMFFVTALLNEVVAWMRGQSGTSSLRALLYMDEVFGYFPPTANPPSKTPMLTLLKQGRAYGLGVVLATQNPVDLDYKGLGNAGTWFLGRLQTERDKARVVGGLEGAAAASTFDRARLEATLSALSPRTFLMVNAHDDQPTLFRTRWSLSYLRGPLTRPQIQSLTAARRPAEAAAAPLPYGARAQAPTRAQAAAPAAVAGQGARPVLPPDVPEMFHPARATTDGRRLEYRPTILAGAKAHYVDARDGIDVWETLAAWAPLPPEGALDPWEAAQVGVGEPPALARQPDVGASFAPLTGEAARGRTYAAWKAALEDHLFRTRALTSHRCLALQATSRPGEGEGDFRARLAQAGRERRDADVEALRRKYAPRITALTDRIRAGEERVERERSQATQQKVSTAVSLGATILGAIFGRRLTSAGTIGRAATTARGVGRAQNEAQDVARAEESAEVLRGRLADLQAEMEAEVARLKEASDPASLAIETVRVPPRKGDLAAGPVSLVWVPYAVAPDGTAEPAV